MYACEMQIYCYSNVKYSIWIKFHFYQLWCTFTTKLRYNTKKRTMTHEIPRHHPLHFKAALQTIIKWQWVDVLLIVVLLWSCKIRVVHNDEESLFDACKTTSHCKPSQLLVIVFSFLQNQNKMTTIHYHCLM